MKGREVGDVLMPKKLDRLWLAFGRLKKDPRDELCLWWCSSPPKMEAATLPTTLPPWWCLWPWRSRECERERERERDFLRTSLMLPDEWRLPPWWERLEETTEKPSKGSQKPIFVALGWLFG